MVVVVVMVGVGVVLMVVVVVVGSRALLPVLGLHLHVWPERGAAASACAFRERGGRYGGTVFVHWD